MSIKKYVSYSSALLALFVFAGTAAAQGTVLDSGSTFSTLTMTATVQTALNLEISTNTGLGGATVTGTAGSGAYALNFGNVNGLGLGTPASNITKTAGTAGYLYTTPITLTASYSGFAPETATIKVNQPAADGAAAVDMAREGSSASIESSTLPAAATMFNAAVTNGQAITRYVGVFVHNANAGATDEAGLRTMHVIYTISVP
jgi:hypothetical protein